MRWPKLIILALTGIGLWQLAAGAWIPVKAELAQWMLQRAWEESLQHQVPVRPWPWADTYPVARLRIPAHDVDLLVLQGDSGRSLAFGPGMAAGSRLQGSTLISGHRDTHFRILEKLREGDEVVLETMTGMVRYRIDSRKVFDSRYQAIAAEEGEAELLLMTCYPFDALVPGGGLRYLVRGVGI